MSNKILDVLLVEDDEESAELVELAVKAGHVGFQLSFVVDGVHAMDYLHQRGRYSGAPRPDLIILDLNLPRKSGNEVLKELKETPSLKDIPIVLLTTTNQLEGIQRAFEISKNCCFTKPDSFNDYIEIVKKMESDFRNGLLLNKDRMIRSRTE